MRSFLGLSNNSPIKYINKVDPAMHQYMYPPTDSYINHHVENFPKELLPPTSSVMTKKFSPPSHHTYKHVYVTAPYKPLVKKKKGKYKEGSWFDDMNPFGEYSSESDIDDDK